MAPSKQIMIIDDDPQISSMIAMYFENEGYAVRAFLSATQALMEIKKSKPNLIILDVMMPDMNGLDALKQIKALDSKIPVILLTGLHDESKAKEAFENHALDYITKPIDMNYLMNIVNSQLA